MKYKTILFDADGVLFNYRKAEKYALQKLFEESKIKFTDEIFEAYKKINHKVWSNFEKGKISTKNLKVERFGELINMFNLNEDPYTFSKSYSAHLSNGYFLFDGAIDLLENLYKKAFLILITNGLSSVQKSRIKLSRIEKYFKYIAISEEIGYPKPDRRIFEHIFDKFGLRKTNAIIVGDSLASDILGGKNFGIKTCLIRHDKTVFKSEITPDYLIYDFNELERILT